MNYCIVKLYLNILQEDWHDISISDFEKNLKDFEAFAKSQGKKLYFVPLTNDPVIGLPVDCTPFAEVEYTGTISKDEKARYIEYIRKFSTSAEINKRNELISFNTLKMIKFRHIDDEIYEM